jgi:hypothetical protein
MGRYIVLYQAPLGVAERFAQATPEEAAAGLQRGSIGQRRSDLDWSILESRSATPSE